MNSILDMCEKIGLQEEIIKEITVFNETLSYDNMKEDLEKLLSFETAKDARAKLKEKLGEDKKGVKILTCMMHCLEDTYKKYKELGISDQIFVDTMNCFPRFIEEHKNSYGFYGFDRDWWTTRQIGMKLFRIGELEYELLCEEKDKVISMHIPSDAKLSIINCRKSYEESKKFIKTHYPEYIDSRYICDSWLLSPALKELLPETSNIIKFQEAFAISEWNKEEKEFIEWVYKIKVDDNNIVTDDYKKLPEDTSLQRNMKQYLLNGGFIGSAYGQLIEKPWDE
jgi:hypothetical protein